MLRRYSYALGFAFVMFSQQPARLAANSDRVGSDEPPAEPQTVDDPSGGADRGTALQFIYETATRKPTVPIRRQRPRGAPSVPAKVPEALDNASPITLTLLVAWGNQGSAAAAIRVMSRDRQRIHLGWERGHQEWLFIRNPKDGRRVSGRLIDHHQCVILDFPDADLHDSGVARGWADVAALGITSKRLATMRATGGFLDYDGVRFARYVAEKETTGAAAFREIWWNENQALPVKIVSAAEDGWVQEIVRMRAGVDAELLRDPEARYPGYMVMDMVDWREEHHGSIAANGCFKRPSTAETSDIRRQKDGSQDVVPPAPRNHR